MKKKDFDNLITGLEEALSYSKGKRHASAREHNIAVDQTFVAQTRLKAGLSQQEFAKVTGASLGTVRKWESGERNPSGAAQMLVRILARAPALVIEEAGMSVKVQKKRRASAA